METEVCREFMVETEPIPESVAQLSTEAINNDLLVYLIENFQLFEFEVL